MNSTESGARGSPKLSYQERRIVAEYESWLSKDFTGPAAFVTLTMKQGLKLQDGTWARLTREIAIQQLAWFLRALDREVLGTSATRFGRKLGRIVALEGGTHEKRLHAHLVLEMPPPLRMTGDIFFKSIENNWQKSVWGREESVCDPCYFTPGAIGYSLKEGSDAIEVSLCEPPHFAPEERRADWQKYLAQCGSTGTLVIAG